MSDYFGALMRASGMPAPATTPTRKREPPAVGPDSLVAADDDAAQQPAAPRPALQPAAPRTALAPSTDGPVAGERPAQRQAPQSGAAAEPSRTRPASVPQPDAELRRPVPARTAGPPVLTPVHPLARAALDWVARGNGAAARQQTATGHAAAPAPMPDHAPVRPLPTGPLAPIASVRESPDDVDRRAGEHPERAASTRDERVEVTIGAIHLRVEAPAARTVASAAPPAPAAGAVPPPSTARSALARRSLRRI